MDKIIMNRKEREQLIVFKKLAEGEVTQEVAAQMLKITPRWVQAKLKRYLKQGDLGLVHKGRGRPSLKRWNPDQCALALELLRSDWVGFGPTFAAEKLVKYYDIKISRETLRKAMRADGISYDTRKKGKRRKRRERRELFGLMVQLDGSPHDWFEGRGKPCTLLVFIDDATSQILWLEFVDGESVHAVMSATKKYFERFGKPTSFYVDYGSVFSVNTNNENREKITQFERAMKELGIEVIHARSPQAKGRVERCNRTMQDRLIKEMRMAKISTMEEANRFVHEGWFIADHNARYAEPPAKQGDAHISLADADLNNILCTKQKRVVMNDYTISYKNKILQLMNRNSVLVRPKDSVTVREHLDGQLSLVARKSTLEFEQVGTRKRTKLSPIEYALMGDLIDAPEEVAKQNFSLCEGGFEGLGIPYLSSLEKSYLDNLALQSLGR